MTAKPAKDDAALEDATNIGGLTPTDEPGLPRGHHVTLVPGPSHTMVDGKVFLDDKELHGVSRLSVDVTGDKPLPKVRIEMRIGRLDIDGLPVDLVVHDQRTADKMLKILSEPTRISVGFQTIDDVGVEMKALFFKIRWILSIILRPWPFYLTVAFPTRKKVGEALLNKKIWVKPLFIIGELH